MEERLSVIVPRQRRTFFSTAVSAQDLPLSFPQRCAFCGVDEDLVEVRIGCRQSVPYCHAHKRQAKKAALLNLAAGCVAVPTIIILGFWFAINKVFVVGFAGFNLLIGAAIGGVVGVSVRFLLGVACSIPKNAISVSVAEKEEDCYLLKFEDQQYLQDFLALNPAVAELNDEIHEGGVEMA